MIYDITQEIFECDVYPGDMRPEFKRIRSFETGDISNATEFAMNAHNGTHIDAPFHRLPNGKAIDELSLSACIGECEVIRYDNKKRIAETDAKRILFSHCDHIDEETARLLVQKEILFLGAEGLSIGSCEVHNILLGAEIVVLEGALLRDIPEGRYQLYAAPIKLGGCDGAPCRAVLIKI